MKRIAAASIATLSVCLSPGAEAQEQQAGQPVRIVITKVDCSRLIRHTPSADVAYQPGVDASGRAVVPADIPGSGANAIPNLLPDVLEFPITINPVSYGARNQAQREKAAALQGQADTYTGKMAAQAQITALNTQRAALNKSATALSDEKTALVKEQAALAKALADLQSEVDTGTRAPSNGAYVRAKWALSAKDAEVAAKQAQIKTNTAQLDANSAAIAQQQSIVDGAAAKDAQYNASQSAAEAKLAAISAKGLDGTAMTVGTVRYDMAKGSFTFNGQPLGSAEQQELARACAKQGVR